MAMQSKKVEISYGNRFQFWFLFSQKKILQYKMEKLTSPNMTFSFDYNLLFLLGADEFVPSNYLYKARDFKYRAWHRVFVRPAWPEDTFWSVPFGVSF